MLYLSSLDVTYPIRNHKFSITQNENVKCIAIFPHHSVCFSRLSMDGKLNYECSRKMDIRLFVEKSSCCCISPEAVLPEARFKTGCLFTYHELCPRIQIFPRLPAHIGACFQLILFGPFPKAPFMNYFTL